MALSERDLNIIRKAPPATKSQSKLPRPVATPNSAPSTTQWTSKVSDRIASAEKAERQTRTSWEKDLPSVARKSLTRKTGLAAINKPLPSDKPLPPRPIARLSNSLSPTKHGRSLMDASENATPIAGGKCDWPALKPSPPNLESPTADSDSVTKDSDTTQNADPPPPATPASVMAAATALTNVIMGRESTKEDHDQIYQTSSGSSYVSANDVSSPAQMDDDSGIKMNKVRQSVERPLEDNAAAPQRIDFPISNSSIFNRVSGGHTVNSSTDSSHNRPDFADLARARNVSPTSTDSRPHSPSPASFSRPRPGSVSTSSVMSKAMKTASRIPIADSKKPTVVDVKKNRLSASSNLKPASTPSFGSRRLASPEALKILENGKIRRQLKRAPANASSGRVKVERSWTTDSNATASTANTPSLSYSFDSSPDGTFAPNSPENCPQLPKEQAEATEWPMAQCTFIQREKQDALEEPLMNDNASSGLDEFDFDQFEDDSPFQTRPPPSKSPFTEPLQTIPSEAALPVDLAYGIDEKETELKRTLSQLEGKCSPKEVDVDRQTLLNMFGHLKRGLDRNSQTSAAFEANAAAAEKYLAQNPSAVSAVNANDDKWTMEQSRQSIQDLEEVESASAKYNTKKQTLLSKWSDSTPSDKGLSPPVEGLRADRALPSTRSRRSAVTSKQLSNATASIGYPSRIPARNDTTGAQSPDEAAIAPNIARRRSSPTLGKPAKQGSVRAARDGMPIGIASFARPTASAQSKRITKLPTPNTKLFVPEASSRGRMSFNESTEPRAGNGTISKTPRSRSRSRYVLDKINGLFSTKRDKKTQEIPPVPRIEETDLTPETLSISQAVQVSAEGSPTRALSRTPQLPKMPSLSPSIQGTCSSEDRATPIESFSNSKSVQMLSEHILGKAQGEMDVQRKERLLNFAKVLNDSLISAREAQISAETAQNAARSAQMSYELTQKSLGMLQRLAARMARSGAYGKR